MKNSLKFALIISLTFLALAIVLPKTYVRYSSRLFNLDTYIGGYKYIDSAGKTVVDYSNFKEGLDIKGGIRIVLKANTSDIPSDKISSALEGAKNIISNRINFLGVSEPNIFTVFTGSDYRIIVEIPGVENVEQAISLVGKTAQLKFKELSPETVYDPQNYIQYYIDQSLWIDSDITGADLQDAQIVNSTDNLTGGSGIEVLLVFSDEGRKKFHDLGVRNIGRPIGIFLDDGLPISMPVVSPEFGEGGQIANPTINGNFTEQGAKELQIQLRSGALPIPVEVLYHETVGATLGNESVNKSFIAGIVGLSLVLLFLILKYRFLGLLAGIALGIYTLLVLAIFKIIPVVLTLPGIAGFVLSIGMATDANILIFERIKEELYWKRPRDLAFKLGFERAWDSIRDSNVSSLITAFILFSFGNGQVRGFALTLALGIIVSIFTSVFVVRTFMSLIFKPLRNDEISMKGVPIK